MAANGPTDELLDATHGLAAGLRDRGLAVGDKVLIHAENSPEMLVSWLACATLGAVAVTTNTRSVVAEIAYFAGHTGCVAAITDAALRRRRGGGGCRHSNGSR